MQLILRSTALVLALLAALGPVDAAVIQNTATGSQNGVPLDPANADVTLNRTGLNVAGALAEISPNQVLAGTVGQAFSYHVRPEIGPGQGFGQLEIQLPPGYGNPAVTAVNVGGQTLDPACPTPVAGEFCVTLPAGVPTIAFGDRITTNLVTIAVDFTADTPPVAGTANFPSFVADGGANQPTTPGDADGDPTDDNSITVEVIRSQGLVLQLTKRANRESVHVGAVVTYSVSIRNTSAVDVLGVRIEDLIPPNFRLIPDSVRLDGAPWPNPTGVRPLVFDIGTVSAPVDSDGSGTVDPGEPGHRTLSYQLVVTTGANPGHYENTAVAKDYCDSCLISNAAIARVEVTLDPLFDLGTIIGKVFHDKNEDGWQDLDEPGVTNAMVALDDGTYALTDAFGRFHFPAIEAGHRMVKLNMASLPPGSRATGSESRVVWATPGLMVRLSIGVLVHQETGTIGQAAVAGQRVSSTSDKPPVEVRGNADDLSLLVNDRQVELPEGDIRLSWSELDQMIELDGDRLPAPVAFVARVTGPAPVLDWTLGITDGRGGEVRTISGTGSPSERVEWDGRDGKRRLVSAGEIYRYQLEVRYADGSRARSPIRLVGVNRRDAISIDLYGNSFENGRDVLSARAKDVLGDAVEILNQHPGEQFIIEGHTDWVGTDEYNLDLSRRRALSAAAFLVEQGFDADRFVLQWYGESRPVASNATDEGRAKNRRVEITAEVERTVKVAMIDSLRADPAARIEDTDVELGAHGRFGAAVDPGPDGAVSVELSDSRGRSAAVAVPVPDLEILEPTGRFILASGDSTGGCTNADGDGIVCRVAGRTQPGNAVELDGVPIAVGPDGSFSAEIGLTPGTHGAGLIARNPAGFARIVNLDLSVTDRDDDGRQIVVTPAIPNLTITLPPRGVKLPYTTLAFHGVTERGSTVLANGKPLTVSDNGSISGSIELPVGPSKLVILVRNAAGLEGTIERDVEVARNQLFLMAFADATTGQLQGDGALEAAGLDDDDEYYTDGRIALYLKGRVAGKYLITAALDTGRGEFNTLFDNMEGDQQQRLLTNLDPDKHYPVYGDLSTLVYDAESRGKLYLALDSDEIHLIVGNYPLSLSDNELAAFRRTLFGARFAYQSLSRTKYGRPDTEVVVFGADVQQAHTRDELRATGGSVYYLSHGDLIEGSEEITLVVRDKNTGLLLHEERQRQNLDYTVKYEEGRVMFHRPIASVVAGGSLATEAVLDGHPVYIHADYERTLNSFEKTASGGRVRQQLGDHLSVGGTRIEDELETAGYELSGVDAELRLGQGTRLTAEYAESEGAESTLFVSQDGGLTYAEVPVDGSRNGEAWKMSAELDIGEWFGKPDRLRVRSYFREIEAGFASSGTFAEQGTDKYGVGADLRITPSDTLRAEHNTEERSGSATVPDGEKTTESLLWDHNRSRWGLATELFSSDTENTLTGVRESAEVGSARFWFKPFEQLRTKVEHQQSFSGVDNDRTTIGANYQVLPSLALTADVTDGDRGQSAQAGLVVTRGETEVYLTERVAEAEVDRRTTTVLGARSPIGESTRVYTEFQSEDAGDDDKWMRMFGLQHQWDPTEGLRFLLSGEVAEVDSSSAADRDRSSVTAGVTYNDGNAIKLQSRQQVRWEDGSTRTIQTFTVNQLDYLLNPDFTLLARYRNSKTEDQDADVVSARFEERSLGVAFRPVFDDRFNSLLKYSRLIDQRPVPAGVEETQREMDIFSVDTAFQFSPRFEWLMKGALRYNDERVGDRPSVETRTYLTIQRLNVTVWKRLALGAEYRVLAEHEFDNQRDGFLTDVTWEILKNFRVGGGYNFTEFTDDIYSINDYSVEGWFVRVQGRY